MPNKPKQQTAVTTRCFIYATFAITRFKNNFLVIQTYLSVFMSVFLSPYIYELNSDLLPILMPIPVGCCSPIKVFPLHRQLDLESFFYQFRL